MNATKHICDVMQMINHPYWINGVALTIMIELLGVLGLCIDDDVNFYSSVPDIT